jgi:hypothetical protein
VIGLFGVGFWALKVIDASDDGWALSRVLDIFNSPPALLGLGCLIACIFVKPRK